jgi:hypothetical protein
MFHPTFCIYIVYIYICRVPYLSKYGSFSSMCTVTLFVSSSSVQVLYIFFYVLFNPTSVTVHFWYIKCMNVCVCQVRVHMVNLSTYIFCVGEVALY